MMGKKINRIFYVAIIMSLITANNLQAQSVSKLYKSAMLNEANGNFNKAIDDYTSILSTNPEEATEYYLRRGKLYYRLNNYAFALADFRKSFALYVAQVEALLSIAKIKMDFAEYDSAIYYTRKVNSMYPRVSEAFFLRGKIYEYLGNRDSACVNYTVAKNLGYLFADAKIRACNDKSKTQNDAVPILALKNYSKDPRYGYTLYSPIRVGNGAVEVTSNCEAYLQLLRDPAGMPVKYEKVDKCCAIRKDSTTKDFILLDRYRIMYTNVSGAKDTRNVLFDTYHYSPPEIIMGFKSR